MSAQGRKARIPRRPTLYYEKRLWDAGHNVVAGADEAGRGAWAGPLVAAAVTLPVDGKRRGRLSRRLTHLGLQVRDSKQLIPEQREAVVRVLREERISCVVVEMPSRWLDRVGLGAANSTALSLALESLVPRPTAGLVDAFRLPQSNIEHRPLIHGDQRSLSIALASIVAKVHRDAIMIDCDQQYPGYGFVANKGYGTHEHQAGIARLGICDLHRRCFAPISALAGDD